jgi:hypothetical protein
VSYRIPTGQIRLPVAILAITFKPNKEIVLRGGSDFRKNSLEMICRFHKDTSFSRKLRAS